MKFRTYLMITAVLVFSFNISFAQLLNYPESVVYDSLRYRYLVSNWSNGDIIQIDSLGQQSYFARNAGLLAGICIVGDTLWAAGQSQGVKGFDMATGEMIVLTPIPDIERLNDIVADASGNLYISDTRRHKIIRYNIASGESNELVNSGLNVPNGMVHDPEHNRLVLVSSVNNSPIQAIDLADSSVTTIIETGIDIMDGIARDEQGNYYISAWGTNCIYRYNSSFSGNPVIFSRHGQSPADISYNKHDDVIAVPLYHSHTLELVPIEYTSIREDVLPQEYGLISNYPNPFNAATVISFTLPESQPVRLDIYNMLGQRVALLMDQDLAAGEYNQIWRADDCPSGIYFARLDYGNISSSIKMVLLK
jgi:hypothetical protein